MSSCHISIPGVHSERRHGLWRCRAHTVPSLRSNVSRKHEQDRCPQEIHENVDMIIIAVFGTTRHART
jgi:hypothetical protein